LATGGIDANWGLTGGSERQGSFDLGHALFRRNYLPILSELPKLKLITASTLNSTQFIWQQQKHNDNETKKDEGVAQ